MKYPFFICSRDDRWRDSWTYGDYTQWLCNRPSGNTQCARVILALPGFALMKAVGPENVGNRRVMRWEA